MTINVKGTKSDPQQPDPSQRYVLKSMDRKSRTPFALGLMLAGLALYLKSIFTSSARPTDESEPVGEEPEGNSAPPLATAQMVQAAAEPAPEGTAPNGEATSSGRLLIELQSPAEFLLVDSPTFELVIPAKSASAGSNILPGPRPRVANDNSGPDSVLPANPGTDEPGSPDPDDNDPGGDDPGPEDTGGPGVETPVDPEDPRDPDSDDDDEENANRAPRVSGPVYLMDVTGCAILAIGLAELLQNAIDPDGDALSVENLTISSGTLTPSVDGWIFRGEPQLEGLVTITYEISDGELSVEQTAYFSVARNHIEGSTRDDIILGTMCADEIDGLEGGDNIDARAGNDIVAGGSGNDNIVAGSGDDVVLAGIGDDIVFGGVGNDHISGGSGNDRLYGGQDDDIVFGDAGDDVVSGEAGLDILDGGDGDDHVLGGDGADTLRGGEGNDRLEGGPGDDMLVDGKGEDVLLGGDGDDHVLAAIDAAGDRIDGGDGNDLLDLSRTSKGVTVDLLEGIAHGSEIGSDAIVSIESVTGGAGDDAIDGSTGRDHLDGGGGDDRLDGGAGDDVLLDGQGSDENLGGSGADYVIAALDQADDHHDGGEGRDALDLSRTSRGVTVDLQNGLVCGPEIGRDTLSAFENLIGGSGDDCFVFDETSTLVMSGGKGEDLFEFLTSESTGAGSATRMIVDFEVGDRVRMSKYDLFEEISENIEDHFEDVYGDDIDEDDVPIRYRHDRVDEMSRTVIEVDFNDDGVWETAISLQGRHVLVVVEYA